MSTRQIGYEYRCRMRELVKGFLEHCERGASCVGRIDHFVWQSGLKYGMPTFMLPGGIDEGGESQMVNILGRNEGTETKIAEGILQIIERLVLQPQIARAFNLRLMPVSNPIALEGAEEDEASKAAICKLLENWKQVAPDGCVEIEETNSNRAQIKVSGDDILFRSVLGADEILWKRHGEHWVTIIEEYRAEIVITGGWEIKICVPNSWSAGISTHMISQFLLAFMSKNREQRLKNSIIGKREAMH